MDDMKFLLYLRLYNNEAHKKRILRERVFTHFVHVARGRESERERERENNIYSVHYRSLLNSLDDQTV
jgi:hypothetical protein